MLPLGRLDLTSSFECCRFAAAHNVQVKKQRFVPEAFPRLRLEPGRWFWPRAFLCARTSSRSSVSTSYTKAVLVR